MRCQTKYEWRGNDPRVDQQIERVHALTCVHRAEGSPMKKTRRARKRDDTVAALHAKVEKEETEQNDDNEG